MSVNDISPNSAPPEETHTRTIVIEKAPKRAWWKWVVVVLLFISVAYNVLLASYVASPDEPDVGVDEHPNVEPVLSVGEAKWTTKAAIVSIDGVIMRGSDGGLFGGGVDPVSQVLRHIRAAINDENVKALLVTINSPGGGVTASDEIYNALLAFKDSDEERIVVAHVSDMAASGGYYIAVASDYIVAQPTSIIGSIGVMWPSINFSTGMRNFGVADETVTSAENKVLLSPLSPIDPQHKDIIQGIVNSMFERFTGLVLNSRDFDAEYADENKLFDGRVFSAPDALRLKLIDEVGYTGDSMEKVRVLLETDEIAFYRYEEPKKGLAAILFGQGENAPQAAPPAGGLQSLADRLLQLPPHGPYYLWMP